MKHWFFIFFLAGDGRSLKHSTVGEALEDGLGSVIGEALEDRLGSVIGEALEDRSDPAVGEGLEDALILERDGKCKWYYDRKCNFEARLARPDVPPPRSPRGGPEPAVVPV